LSSDPSIWFQAVAAVSNFVFARTTDLIDAGIKPLPVGSSFPEAHCKVPSEKFHNMSYANRGRRSLTITWNSMEPKVPSLVDRESAEAFARRIGAVAAASTSSIPIREVIP
jgi:hypothetical protein